MRVILYWRHVTNTGWSIGIWILDVDIWMTNKIRRKTTAHDRLDAEQTSNFLEEQALTTDTEFFTYSWNVPSIECTRLEKLCAVVHNRIGHVFAVVF